MSIELTSSTHTLKTVEPYFTAVLVGEKTFEVRRNDRAFQKGDVLLLTDVSGCDCGDMQCGSRREPIRKVVSFVYAGDPSLRDLGGLLPGHVILGLADPAEDPIIERILSGFGRPERRAATITTEGA